MLPFTTWLILSRTMQHWLQTRHACTRLSFGKKSNLFSNIAAKRVEKQCCRFIYISPPFEPVNNLICCKTGLKWVAKRATSLFNSFEAILNVFCCPFFRTFRTGGIKAMSHGFSGVKQVTKFVNARNRDRVCLF